jgi:hypothetical protein
MEWMEDGGGTGNSNCTENYQEKPRMNQPGNPCCEWKSRHDKPQLSEVLGDEFFIPEMF